MIIKPLSVSQLRRTCAPRSLKFKTTASLPIVDDIIGQPRAVRAIDFGLEVRGPGFNVFLMGPGGTGRMTVAERFLAERAAQQPTPSDWIYVHNFAAPLRPRAMALPPGRARVLQQEMNDLITFLKTDVPRLFNGEVYQRAASRLMRDLDEKRTAALARFDQQARERGFALMQSDQEGWFVTPLGPQGEPAASPEALAALSEEQRAALAQAQPDVQDAFSATLRQVHDLESELRDRLRELDRQTIAEVLQSRLDQISAHFRDDCPEVIEYVAEVRADIIAHAAQFRTSADETAPAANTQPAPDLTQRFRVNVLVDHGQTCGAPIVYEPHPTFMNLIGRIERDLQLGENVLDFTMLRAGSLLRANGGYLVLRAQDVLKDGNTWEALKRALTRRQLVIEDPGTQLQMFSTRTLESEPIPLDVKVVLLGTPHLYYDLYEYDEDFERLFKVKAEFATDMARTPENEQAYALFVRARCAEHGLPPFEAGAVAQLIEYGSRLAEDQTKLSAQFGEIADVIIEAAHWARKAERPAITAGDVQRALAEWRYRSNLVEQEVQEPIIDGTIAVQVSGEVVGQINGLTVISSGNYEFGHPVRISARIYVGRGGVLVIEREVHLSGRIHNKGALTLEGYLHGQYATTEPLSLAASLSFEQNYSEIEGDSAASTELYALLSALADLPIKQGIAVTGSVDQLGRVQPVGGVQCKIEGFFDICQARGLTGEQGALIPAANVKHLMLRADVVEACRQGQFHVWAVNTIDEGLELLTGVKAGRRGKIGRAGAGAFTRNSVHARVAARLKQIADQLDGRKDRDEEQEEAEKKEKEKKEEETRTRRRRKKAAAMGLASQRSARAIREGAPGESTRNDGSAQVAHGLRTDDD